MIELPEGPFSILYCDPPWSFTNYSDKWHEGRKESRWVGNEYGLMTPKDINSLPVNQITAKDAICFLWATFPTLPRALETMASWGFTYSTVAFVWHKTTKHNKDHFGMGFWTRCLAPDTKVYVQHKASKAVTCFGLGTLIEAGIAEYQIWTPSGWRDILGFEESEGPSYSIDTKMGRVVCSPDHKWLAKVPYMPRDKDQRSKRLHSYRLRDLTAAEIGVRFASKKSMAAAATNLLFSRHPIASDAPIASFGGFDLNEDAGWVVGLWTAEGSGTKRARYFHLHAKEQAYRDRLSAIVDGWAVNGDRFFRSKVKVRHFIKGNRSVSQVSSSRIREFIGQSIMGFGAHRKRLNLDWLLNTPISFRHGLLMGFLEGDGTKGEYGYSGFLMAGLCNEGLVDDIRDLALSLGVMAYTRPVSTRTVGKGAGNAIYRVAFATHDGQADEGDMGRVRLTGVTSSSVPQRLIDIAVDGEYFIVNDLVSHNSNAEIVLLGTKGHPKRVSKSVRQIVHAPVGKHSAKPPEVRDRIVELMGDLPRIELFAREQTPGWTAWGDEV